MAQMTEEPACSTEALSVGEEQIRFKLSCDSASFFTMAATRQITRRLATQSVQIIDRAPIRARLEEHYYNNIQLNLAILNYNHASTDASIDALNQSKELNYKVESPLERVYTTRVADLPTKPSDTVTQTLLTTELQNVGLPMKSRKYKQKLYNPVDYTSIRKEVFNAPPPAVAKPAYSPLPSRLPSLKKIVLKIWDDEAVANKYSQLTQEPRSICRHGTSKHHWNPPRPAVCREG
jgi:hypothetical protein